MAKGFYKAIVKALSKNGYKKIDGGKGSHEKWQCQETGKITLVPHNTKSRHTANSILKDADIDLKF